MTPDTLAADSNARRTAREHGWRVLGILSLLMGFAAISTDLYLPAMPMMAKDLNAAHGMMEWTISGYLIGFSLGQLFWGPIGDRFGRRVPIAIGISLFLVGSTGCALSDSATVMIGWRLVQAFGACASVVLARAMVRDMYEGPRAAQMMSTLMVVMGIAPLVGPFVGGQIMEVAGWQAIFWLMDVIGVIALLALMTMPETLPLARRNHDPISRAMMRYVELVKHPTLLAYAGAGSFFYSGIFAYVAGTPFAYITYHHVPPQYYGFLFAIGMVGIMSMNFFNARLVHKIGSKKLFLIGSSVTAVAGSIVAINAYTDFGGIVGLVAPLCLFLSMSGLIIANSITGALENFPDRAGAVSALVGSMQFAGGILGSALVGAFANGTPAPLGAVMAMAGIGCFLCGRMISISKA